MCSSPNNLRITDSARPFHSFCSVQVPLNNCFSLYHVSDSYSSANLMTELNILNLVLDLFSVFHKFHRAIKPALTFYILISTSQFVLITEKKKMIPEISSIDGRGIQNDRVLLVISSIGSNGYNRVDSCKQKGYPFSSASNNYCHYE